MSLYCQVKEVTYEDQKTVIQNQGGEKQVKTDVLQLSEKIYDVLFEKYCCLPSNIQ